MKAMLMAFVATALISVAAYYTLQGAGYSAAEKTTAPSSVRLNLRLK